MSFCVLVCLRQILPAVSSLSLPAMLDPSPAMFTSKPLSLTAVTQSSFHVSFCFILCLLACLSVCFDQ